MNLPPAPKKWQKTARVYQERADEYDSWYDNSPLFATELAALQQVAPQLLPEPKIEIGAGPGRFAEQLGIRIGIDPAPAALQHGLQRGITGMAGIGEQLPIRSQSVGTIFLLFTLCFLEDPDQVLRECRRVLMQNGCVVIGMVPAHSPWGRQLEEKKQQGNPYYRYARFQTIASTRALLAAAGFSLLDSYSTLLQPPGGTISLEAPQPGINEQAGFCVLLAHRGKN
jgi:ubiquinone/menaquinone biosynthesis C-methylase UbiE